MTRAAFQLRRFLAGSLLAILLFSGLFGFTLSQVHAASAPNILNYQGRLLNANGVPISSASVSMIFALYTTLATGSPGDAECVWTNSNSSGAAATARTVTLTDGLFSENLGDTAAGTPYAAISDSVFANNATLYLDITVAGESLTPRKQIVSAPYAMNSDTLDGFDSTQVGATTAAALVLSSAGNLKLTGNPDGSTYADGSLLVNPATADVSANDVLFGIAVTSTAKFTVDAEGDTVATGDLAVNGGDFTTSATTFNLLTSTATTLSFASAATTLNIDNAAGVSTKTINIGGTSADSPDAINIATEGTQADTIIIGNAHASTLFTLTGGNDWSIGSNGNIATTGIVAANGGSVTSSSALALSSTGGDISLAPNGSGLVYVTAGDNFAVGNTTTTAAFSVTEATNIVRIGDGVSDTNNPTIAFYASNASATGSLSYLDADAFDLSGGDLVHTAIATTAGTIGQHFINDSVTSGIGMSITRADAGSAFTGALLSVAQNNTSATSTGNALVVVQDANNTSCTASPCAKGIFIAQAHSAPHIADDPGESALAIDIGDAGSADDAIVLRAGPVTTFRVTTGGDAYADGAFTGGGADLAEYFPTNSEALSGGQVVCQDSANNNYVTQCTPGQANPIGVISTNPAFIGNNVGDSSEDLRHNSNYSLVGLIGQIDTLVDDSRGVINIGDPITASSTTSGYGAKAIGAGRIVGYALEPLSSSTGTIRVLVQPQWFGGSVAAPAPATSAEVVAANPVVTADNSVSGLTDTSTLDVDGSLNMNGGRILAVSSLQGLGSTWSLSANGDFTTHGQLVGLVTGYSGAPVETYATMSRQHLIQLSGTSTLQNGIARILFADVDPQFADIISNTSPYRVIATPSGLTGQIYISERDLAGFTIRDINNSNGVEVDWLVMAYHKDFAPVSATTEPVQADLIGGVTMPRSDEPVSTPSSTNPVIDPSADTTAPTTEPVTTETPIEAPVVVDEPTTVPESVADPITITEPVAATDPAVGATILAEPVASPDPIVTSEPVAESAPVDSAPAAEAPATP